VRPWLYRIARNRSLNHLRRTQAVGVDSMDVHLSEGGTTTADKVHKREEFRLLVSDVQDLPETQRTALLLREIDALSYEQIADAMETTVPSVKSLLVRARVSLAEAAEARLLTCEEVRDELGEVAEGLRRTSAPVRRHLRTCDRCTAFRKQLRETNKALAAVFPVAPLLLLKKTLLAHLGTTAAASGGTAAAAGGGTAAAGAAAGGALQAGASALATKAAAGLAAAAIVTAGAVEAKHVAVDRSKPSQAVAAATPAPAVNNARSAPVAINSTPQPTATKPARHERAVRKADKQAAAEKPTTSKKTTVKDGTLVAAVTPLREQREGDTAVPTDTTGSTQPGGGSLPPGQTAPQTQPTPAPSQPSPQPSGTPTASPSPTPVPAVTPTPTPSPDPTPDPVPTPTPTPLP
jgi:hypothetical protein